MFAFDIFLNGERIITAGTEDWGLVEAAVVANRARAGDEADLYELKVGGVAEQAGKGSTEHLRWARREIHAGDEVTLRLVDVPEPDGPTKRYRSDREVQESPFTDEERRQMKWQTYLDLKRFFEQD